jgi:hypothetical protein
MLVLFIFYLEQLVKESSRIERIGNNLRFVETEKSDSGKYECVAGNVRSPMMLNVISKYVCVPTFLIIEDYV